MTPRERVVVHRSRPKFLTLGVFMTVMGLLGIVAGADAGEWWVITFGILFTGFGTFALRQGARRDPAVVIDRDGIESRLQGYRLSWDEVEEIRTHTSYAGRFVRQKLLVFRVRDIDRVVRQAPNRFARAVGALDRRLGVRSASIPLSMLSMRPSRILEAVRGFCHGPISGKLLGDWPPPDAQRENSVLGVALDAGAGVY